MDIVAAFGHAGGETIATDADPLAPALYHAHRHEPFAEEVPEPVAGEPGET